MRSKRIKKTGLPPGSVVFTGTQKVEHVFLHHLYYDESSFREESSANTKKIIFEESPENRVDWHDLRGLHDTKLIEFIGASFKIHSLILEDVADIYQRPKFEEFEDGIFVTIKSLTFDASNIKIIPEQVAIFFRKGVLFSFQETETDIFAEVRHRLVNAQGRIRKRGSDYLCYALLDLIVDKYFHLLDQIEDVVDDIETEVMQDPKSDTRDRIHYLKKQLVILRKFISPLREAVSQFSRSESNQIQENTEPYIRDLYDHTIQLVDRIESYRDTLNGLQDLYISEISYRMNQVMQVLTIVTTIFVPLSFLAGLYGMNFEYMPELKFRYSYFILLGLMVLILIGSLTFFKRRKWF